MKRKSRHQLPRLKRQGLFLCDWNGKSHKANGLVSFPLLLFVSEVEPQSEDTSVHEKYTVLEWSKQRGISWARLPFSNKKSVQVIILLWSITQTHLSPQWRYCRKSNLHLHTFLPNHSINQLTIYIYIYILYTKIKNKLCINRHLPPVPVCWLHNKRMCFVNSTACFIVCQRNISDTTIFITLT